MSDEQLPAAIAAERLRIAEAKVADFEQDARDRERARRNFNLQALIAIGGSAVSLFLTRFIH